MTGNTRYIKGLFWLAIKFLLPLVRLSKIDRAITLEFILLFNVARAYRSDPTKPGITS